ncbi:MAG: tetratricopeptide repeat protein [Saprospiraceae bacterium]|nr:tetratricopeptide repeat protein [Saprospiraceae bacterium]
MSVVQAQDVRLAQQYQQEGEYEKAAAIYEQLMNQNQRNDYYFDRYIECLVALNQFNAAEQSVKKQMRKSPDNIRLHVTYGNLLALQDKETAANDEYQTAIKKLPPDKYQITNLANAFLELSKYQLAVEVYEKGEKLLNEPYLFAYNLAELHRRKGDYEKMVAEYLNSLASNAGRLETIKSLLQRYLPTENYEFLKTQLYDLVQKEPNADYYTELLTWVFIQEKDYSKALRQVRALDRRAGENGGRVFDLAQIAINDGDYDAAIEAFQYIIEKKGPTSSFYLDAKRDLLRAKRSKIVEGYNYTQQDLVGLQVEYTTFLQEFGKNKLTAPIIIEYAELEALYVNNLDKAIELLSELIEYPGMNRGVLANGKLDLANYYLMQGEIWESTLLYSQVDKEFVEDLLGHEARYLNAKLSYYAGDFQWAQAQFDVLKSSTSKLIANDALDMAVFIMDNLGLDTTTVPLQHYASAELLVFQNRFADAFLKLDTLGKDFPEHGLQDDILYLKAQIYKKQRRYQEAETAYQAIITQYKEEIRADNAMFELAQLYENQLKDIEKAKSLYESLFIDFSGSTFAVEARKRYRVLRGDQVQ